MIRVVLPVNCAIVEWLAMTWMLLEKSKATDLTDSTETWHYRISEICQICGCFLDFADVFCLNACPHDYTLMSIWQRQNRVI
jgi:hypothetical protein